MILNGPSAKYFERRRPVRLAVCFLAAAAGAGRAGAGAAGAAGAAGDGAAATGPARPWGWWWKWGFNGEIVGI